MLPIGGLSGHFLNLWMQPLGMGFFGINLWPDKREKSQFNALALQNEFATNTGEHDISTASNFMRDIVSGDPTKIARALAPQISQSQQRTQQGKNQLAEFSPRSGGTAAAAADMDRQQRADITNLTGNLTGQSVSGLASLGTSLFGMGQSGTEAAFGESQVLHQQRAQATGDIVKSIEDVLMSIASMKGVSPGVSQNLNAIAGFGG